MDEVKAKTETDWAMMYAEERKLRMDCQDRLAAFMIHGPSLANVAKDVVFGILETNEFTHSMMEDLVRTIKDANDIIACVNYNVFRPVWDISDVERNQLKHAKDHEQIPPDMIERLSKLFIEAGKEQDKKWHDICHEQDLRCPTAIDDEDRERFEMLFKRRIQE